MVVVPRFKRAFGYTHVRLLFLVINSFYRCLINNSIGLAFPRQWAGNQEEQTYVGTYLRRFIYQEMQRILQSYKEM